MFKDAKLEQHGYMRAEKSPRIFAFLLDLFFNLILSFVLFAFVSMPIAEKATGFSNKVNHQKELQTEVYNIFYDSKLYEKGADNKPVGKLTMYEEYRTEKIKEYKDHTKERNDTFVFYYLEKTTLYSSRAELYHDIFGLPLNASEENTSQMFMLDTSVSDPYSVLPLLREDNNFAKDLSLYDENNLTSVSKKAEEAFQDFYSRTWDKADKYLKLQEPLKGYLKEFNNINVYQYGLLSSSLWASYLFSSLIFYLIMPFILKDGRTLGMLIFKAKRIDAKIKKYNPVFNLTFFLLNVVTNAFLMIVMALPMIGIGRLATLELIPFVASKAGMLIFAFVGAFPLIVNFFLASFTPNELSVHDLCTHSYMVENVKKLEREEY